MKFENVLVDTFLMMLRDKDRLLALEQERLQRRRKLLANTIRITESSYEVEEGKIICSGCTEEYMILSEMVREKNEKVLAEILGLEDEEE